MLSRNGDKADSKIAYRHSKVAFRSFTFLQSLSLAANETYQSSCREGLKNGKWNAKIID